MLLLFSMPWFSSWLLYVLTLKASFSVSVEAAFCKSSQAF